MGSQDVLLPPDSRFRRLYYFTSAEHALSGIALRRVKIARLSELNDPFELYAASGKLNETRQRLRLFKEQESRKTGLVCFSKNWTNPVLWSHYGRKHEGICLGFDVAQKDLVEVAYTPDRFPIPDGPITAPVRSTLLRTKSTYWAYEEEVRRIVNLRSAVHSGSLFFIPFGPRLRLVEIIVGLNCSAELADVRRLLQMSGAQHAVCFRTRVADKWFDIVPDGHTVL